MTEKFTKAEAESLTRAVQDIRLFLRLARLRIENKPDAIPFKAVIGNLVLGWLDGLATRYATGEDITV